MSNCGSPIKSLIVTQCPNELELELIPKSGKRLWNKSKNRIPASFFHSFDNSRGSGAQTCTMLPALFLVVATLASHALAQQRVLLDVEVAKLLPVADFAPFQHLFLNGPRIRGAMTFTNGRVVGGDTMEMTAQFEPAARLLHYNLSSPGFQFSGNYTANLQLIEDNGDATPVHGAGFIDVHYKDYRLWDASYKIKYNPYMLKYQCEYPTYKVKIGSITGEITGLVNAKTGEPVDLATVLKIGGSYEKPKYIEFYRALANHYVRRGYAQALGSGFANILANP